MDCPNCYGKAGWSYGMSGNPDSNSYYICAHCGLCFYYTKKGKLFIWRGDIKTWKEANLKERVIFT